MAVQAIRLPTVDGLHRRRLKNVRCQALLDGGHSVKSLYKATV
jgi:hypothetical protein